MAKKKKKYEINEMDPFVLANAIHSKGRQGQSLIVAFGVGQQPKESKCVFHFLAEMKLLIGRVKGKR